jgi:hypothetical protein
LLRRSQWREWKSMFIIIFVTFMQAYILVWIFLNISHFYY